MKSVLSELYDCHMHTPLCRHAQGEPDEYAEVAVARGLKGIFFTCHNPVSNWHPEIRMELAELPLYIEMIEATKERFDGRLEVHLGLESDYCPGMERWLEELHEKAPFNFILGSVHPHLTQYQKLYFNGDIRQFFQLYFDHLVLAAESGLFDSLAHPDLVKNCFPDQWSFDSMLPHIQRSLDKIAKTGVAMELNTSGLNKRIPEMNPSLGILRELAARGIPVTLGSDSHVPERVGADFGAALDLLTSSGVTELSYFLGRHRHTLPIGGE